VERLHTARQVADQLGVSTGALLRWTRAGKVPGAVKLPSGAIRYIPDQIDAWLTELTMADGATEEVSPAPDTVRRVEVSSAASPVPLRGFAARTEEEPPDAC
jgi:predicted DNA-binding transcriptional regulator AlpA